MTGPVNLVNLERAVKAYGARPLLDGVSAGVSAGDRIGIVGRNGAGKSTLLAVLAGREPLDSGRATRARDVRIGLLGQRTELAGTVRDVVLGAVLARGDHPPEPPSSPARGGHPSGAPPVAEAVPEHVWAANPRTRSILAALLPGIDLDAAAGRLSGGESRRVALAAVLTGQHDLLLLDEPTNHLDVEAIDWLARHLMERPEALAAVTHDRWFLDAVCNRTWELAGGQLHTYDGGYAAYVLARAERARIAEATDRRRRNLLRKELAWLRRGPPARTSKPRFRIEAANALIAGEPPPRDGVELTRLATARLGKTVIDAAGVTVTAGSRILLNDVTWQLGPGERVGLVGPNGSGKSTLLNLLARGDGPPLCSPGGLPPEPPAPDRRSAPSGGKPPRARGDGPPEPPDRRSAPSGGKPPLARGDGPPEPPAPGLGIAGEITRGKTVRLGYLRQSDTELDPALTPREAVTEVRGTLDSAQGAAAASALLDQLGLRGDTQWTPAAELSGGERRRLQLLRILLAEPNVLFLDEPTNDLDVDTLTELEDLLDGWPGSLVLVSHDRYFLERVTDHVLALAGDGRLSYLPGGVDEYLERRRAAADALAAPAAAGPDRPAAAAGTAPPPGSAATQRAARKEMQRLERQLGRLTAREAELTAELAANASDYIRLTELGDQLRGVQQEKGRLEDEWLAAAELSG